MGNGQISDHDLLIRIDERVTNLHACLKDHLKHHWAVTLAAAAAVISAILSWIF